MPKFKVLDQETANLFADVGINAEVVSPDPEETKAQQIIDEALVKSIRKSDSTRDRINAPIFSTTDNLEFYLLCKDVGMHLDWVGDPQILEDYEASKKEG